MDQPPVSQNFSNQNPASATQRAQDSNPQDSRPVIKQTATAGGDAIQAGGNYTVSNTTSNSNNKIRLTLYLVLTVVFGGMAAAIGRNKIEKLFGPAQRGGDSPALQGDSPRRQSSPPAQQN